MKQGRCLFAALVLAILLFFLVVVYCWCTDGAQNRTWTTHIWWCMHAVVAHTMFRYSAHD